MSFFLFLLTIVTNFSGLSSNYRKFILLYFTHHKMIQTFGTILKIVDIPFYPFVYNSIGGRPYSYTRT